MAFQIFQKCKCSQCFAKLQQKFSATILKDHSTKRENAFQNSNLISFLTRVSKEGNKLSFAMSKKAEQMVLHCSLCLRNMGKNHIFVPRGAVL